MSSNNAFDSLPDLAILRLPRVMEITGKSRPSIYAAAAAKRFPAPIKLGSAPGCRSSGWRVGDIRAWLKDPTSYVAANDGAI